MTDKNKELNISIGSRIQRARKSAGLTQMVFAEKIGVSPQYVSDLERGVVGASVSTIIKICQVLEISSDYILLGIDPSTQQPVDLFFNIQKFSSEQQSALLQGIRYFQKAFQ